MRASRLLKWTVLFMVMGLVLSMPGMSGAITEIRDQPNMDNIEVASKTLVILGASYAGGWPSDRSVVGYRVINKGVNGQQSYEMLARFENDVVTLNPDAVLIWGFINDIFRSDSAQIEETLKRTRESMRAMVALAKQAGIIPILATEVTIRGRDGWKETIGEMIASLLGKTSYQDYVNTHVRETNRWIRDLAVREGIRLLDFETVLVDQRGVRRKDLSKPDGSHISEAGYKALARYSEAR